MDAMTEYFYFNYDECLRKVITSLENYFINYNLRLPPKSFWDKFRFFKTTKFKKLINHYITENYYAYKERDLKILRDNIKLVYRARNEIVHNRLRVSPDNMMFCKKAIGTLLYIYQSKMITDDNKFKYIFSFYLQFQGIADMIIGLNLDQFAEGEKQGSHGAKILENDDDLNNAIFSDLKITNEEQRQVGL